MSANVPLQRAMRSATTMTAFTHSIRPRIIFPILHHTASRRTLFGFLKRNRENLIVDPMSEKYGQRKQKDNAIAEASANRRGGIASGSIFDEETKPQTDEKTVEAGETQDTSPRNRDPTLMAAALDPRPKARKRWEQKMVVRDVRARRRINKATLIARTERQHLSKSPFIKTSIKKLMPLARQIAGKPIEDALIQMRFSKKKAAKEILKHLERARDEAIVARGMGLGGVDGSGNVSQRMVVEDKKGHKRVVNDKTDIYIDQAWVGRGKPDYGIDYRARGQAHRLTKPYTSISVVLKEEKTRIRQMNERTDKLAAKTPWLHLSDRPVTRQHQFPLW